MTLNLSWLNVFNHLALTNKLPSCQVLLNNLCCQIKKRMLSMWNNKCCFQLDKEWSVCVEVREVQILKHVANVAKLRRDRGARGRIFQWVDHSVFKNNASPGLLLAGWQSRWGEHSSRLPVCQCTPSTRASRKAYRTWANVRGKVTGGMENTWLENQGDTPKELVFIYQIAWFLKH